MFKFFRWVLGVFAVLFLIGLAASPKAGTTQTQTQTQTSQSRTTEQVPLALQMQREWLAAQAARRTECRYNRDRYCW